jgi:hypothetical protein
VRVFWATCSIVVVIMVIAMVRQATAAGSLLYINPMAGGAAAWALGPMKAWFGICRFEPAGALVARQCGCTCLALYHLRRHGRTHSTLLSSVGWNRVMVFWVARLITVAAIVMAAKPPGD